MLFGHHAPRGIADVFILHFDSIDGHDDCIACAEYRIPSNLREFILAEAVHCIPNLLLVQLLLLLWEHALPSEVIASGLELRHY